MRSRIDWISNWFDLYKEHGEFTDIPIGIENDTGDIGWHFFRHEEDDGLSALKKIINITPPEKKLETSLLDYLSGILTYLKFSKIQKLAWIKCNDGKNGEKLNPHTLLLSEENFLQLKNKSKTLGVSVNTVIVGAVDRAVRARLLKESVDETFWLIPYNMRGGTTPKKNNHNYSSHSLSLVKKNGSYFDIEFFFKRMRKGNYHLGAWAFLNIGLIVGAKGTRAMMNHLYNSRHSWCGSVSNLGSFELSGFRWAVYFCPPVTTPYPVGVGAITVNNKFTLSFLFHPILDINQKQVTEILDDVKNELNSL